jgi:MSHA biogenesis protein MshP
VNQLNRQHGFSLVSAIFILVVMSAAGVAMINLVGAERRTSTFALQGTRAYNAARSGVEWAVAKIAADPSTCPAAVFALSEGGLNGFSVQVTCSSSSHVENTVTTNVFRIIALAEYSSFGDPDYVSRRLEATVTGEP